MQCYHSSDAFTTIAAVSRLAVAGFGGLALLTLVTGSLGMAVPAVIAAGAAIAVSLGVADLATRDRVCILWAEKKIIVFQDFHEHHIEFKELESCTLQTGVRTRLLGPETKLTVKALSSRRSGEYDNSHLTLPPPLHDYDGPLVPWKGRSMADLWYLVWNSLIPGRSSNPTMSLPRDWGDGQDSLRR